MYYYGCGNKIQRARISTIQWFTNHNGIRNVRKQNDDPTLMNFAINFLYSLSEYLTIHRED